LRPLSFEQPHLEMVGAPMEDLQAGRYPTDGDLSWAENLEAAIISWTGTPAAPPVPSIVPGRPAIEEAREESVNLAEITASGSQDWHSRFGGIEWRYDERGVYLRATAGGREPLRTPGEPLTCRAIWRLFAEHILAAARKYGVAPELIMMTIATETAFAVRYGFTGPHTFRWEPNVEVTDVNPPIYGDYSAGPMQTLATTARWIIRQQHLPYDPFVVAPVYRSRPSPPETHPLYDPARNIDIGTAEIKQRWSATGDDPILVAAAFNAGGLYRNNQNQWHLRSYGDHLDRAAKWYGDACAVLAELRA
jgi:peptidoglycan L-alanyl-D-glutamate endopeptidase CwlK